LRQFRHVAIFRLVTESETGKLLSLTISHKQIRTRADTYKITPTLIAIADTGPWGNAP
jgi:hypothetical protein